MCAGCARPPSPTPARPHAPNASASGLVAAACPHYPAIYGRGGPFVDLTVVAAPVARHAWEARDTALLNQGSSAARAISGNSAAGLSMAGAAIIAAAGTEISGSCSEEPTTGETDPCKKSSAGGLASALTKETPSAAEGASEETAAAAAEAAAAT